jgi:ATP-binding cassette subfamily B protein
LNEPATSAPPRAPLAFVRYYVGRGFRGHILGMAALVSLNTGFDAFQTYALGQLIAAVAEREAATGWFTVVIFTWLSANIFARGYGVFTSYSMMAIRVRVHDDLFAYVMNHAPRYFLDQASGALAHKVRLAAGSCTTIIDYVTANVPRLFILLGLTVVAMLTHVPQVLPLFAVFLAVFAAVSAWLAQKMRAYAKEAAETASAQSSRIVDTVSNWDTVLSFARGTLERGALLPFSQREASAHVRLRLVATAMRLGLHVLSVVFIAWFLWQALSDAAQGRVDLAAFTMLVTLSMLVAGHINALGDNLFVYFETYGSLSNALDTILAPHEVIDAPGAAALTVTGGAIALKGVRFAYPDGTTVFDGLDLAVAPGEKVGLVGPSGAGKSTLIKLIRRHFPIQSGVIAVDGQDIAAVTWNSLHHAMAEVPQNPGLFHRSVRDNILYGRPEAGEEEMIAAARQAHCHEFISTKPGGYDAVVGERGMKLSGGEKQRVAIARAFLKNAPILILDEATSALDSEAEHLIQDALLKLMVGRTVIAIAHRLSTIMHLDRIVVLDSGRIVEQGSHAELLALDRVYAQLWKRQAGGFI